MAVPGTLFPGRTAGFTISQDLIQYLKIHKFPLYWYVLLLVLVRSPVTYRQARLLPYKLIPHTGLGFRLGDWLSGYRLPANILSHKPF